MHLCMELWKGIKMENSYRFFNNKDCKYFPCHSTPEPDEFNCLFCFCPLYSFGSKCGGNFSYTKNNVKNCMNCTLPHQADFYDFVLEKLKK